MIVKKCYWPLSQFSPYLVESSQVHSYPPNASVHFFPDSQLTLDSEHSFTSAFYQRKIKFQISNKLKRKREGSESHYSVIKNLISLTTYSTFPSLLNSLEFLIKLFFIFSTNLQCIDHPEILTHMCSLNLHPRRHHWSDMGYQNSDQPL